jgi:hypothetical protein
VVANNNPILADKSTIRSEMKYEGADSDHVN